MKNLLNIRAMVITSVLLLTAISVSAVERPFAMDGNGLASFILNDAGEPTGATITASGNATHLGLASYAGTLKFTRNDSDPTVSQVTGDGVFTASNGDQLSGVLEDATVSFSTGLGQGKLRIISGTGRFANASGLINLVVVQSPTGAFTFTMVGSIDY